jgi:hypothetical protein
MKTSVEINGYLITIEEVDGVISVNAAKDDEVIEEFTITVEESEEGFEGEEGDDVRPFGEYGEEEDFDSDDDDDVQDEIQDELQDDEEDEDNDDEDELQGRALESFQSFINKKK